MERHTPWQFESGRFRYSRDLLDSIYTNRNIKYFLEIGNHDHNFLLVGPKGIGKTLFINLKSYLYRNDMKDSGIHFYPRSGQLCENLVLDNNSLSKDDLVKFINLSTWTRIWRLVLSTIACQVAGKTVENPILKECIGNAQSISMLLTNILMDRRRLEDFLDQLRDLTQIVETINNSVCIFIDNIDQAFGQFLVDYHASDFDDEGNPKAVSVWTNAQTGLMSAIYELNRHNSHIKVYSSIRQEAFACLENQMKLNYRNYATFLSYTKEEVKTIFEKNIELMDRSELVCPEVETPIEQFLGVKNVGHSVAKTPNGTPRREPIFDFLYRHTFGRPRELVFMGDRLYRNVIGNSYYQSASGRERVHMIREEIRKSSDVILDVYLDEIIPKFDRAGLHDFIKTVQSNVIPSDYVKKSQEHLIKKYFSIGILGFTQRNLRSNKEHELEQKFLAAAEHSYKENLTLPNTKYFLTHPCLDRTLSRVLDLSFYNPYNIVGNKKKFQDHPDFTQIYDVAFSYSYGDGEYVEEVANQVNRYDLKVFYDKENIKRSWGYDLEQYLSNVFGSYAKFCVLFISKSYMNGHWSMFELEEVLKRYDSLKDRSRFILPVKLDDIEIEIESLKNVIFLDARRYTQQELAEIIYDICTEKYR